MTSQSRTHNRFLMTGLPHTQGIQGNSGNFQVEENLRETQGNSGSFHLFFKLRETQRIFEFFKKVQGSFKILKISENFFARFRMRYN